MSLDAMEEVVVVEPGASSASAAPDCDESLSQPTPIALVESIDEALVPDIIAGSGTLSYRFCILVVLLFLFIHPDVCVVCLQQPSCKPFVHLFLLFLFFTLFFLNNVQCQRS